jgi:hypothetical protein
VLYGELPLDRSNEPSTRKVAAAWLKDEQSLLFADNKMGHRILLRA